jgi:CMP-N,N'-diacetyllegionaminic acid synthase
MSVLALIPARGGSKGVPKKNIKSFNGKPLISYTINDALNSKLITHVVVSTDSQEIADVALKYNAIVPFLRPKNIAEDVTSDFPVMEHAIKWYKKQGQIFDYMVFLRPTNLFRSSNDIDKGINKINKFNYDSIRSISEVNYSPYWMKTVVNDKLVNFLDSKYSESRRQDLPKVYQANGAVDIIKIDTILKKKSRYGNNIGYFKMNEISNVDIDTQLDFEIAEFLYKRYRM